jgi:hypothetical protein
LSDEYKNPGGRLSAFLGAPQALQVVDRFHMVKNLGEVFQGIIGHCRAEIC